MQELESRRLRGVNGVGNGLIIPVVLRGEKRFPALLKSRKYYRFTDIELSDPTQKIEVKYAKDIKEIAERIVDLCELLDASAQEPPHDCNEYCLPSDEDARAFVEMVLGKRVTEVAVPFVARADTPGGT